MKTPVLIKAIQQIVCEYYGITHDMLKCRTRTHELAHPRMVSMYLCRALTPYSIYQIAEAHGRLNRSMLSHAKTYVSNRTSTDKSFRSVVETLRSACESIVTEYNHNFVTS